MDASRPHGSVIYVVDDDPAVRQALEFALELEGFDVRVFPSGEALLLAPLPGTNGCLVLDEKLPGLSGMETLRQLRARGVSLPAIFVTSHPNPHFRALAAAANTPILEKPLTGDELLASIRAAVARL